ncbi:MAG: GNAT family N-acetyltransferase [Bacteroidales bacterium]|nr:GNAT family N-acetyltransferase [Bacteroidales bacterium]
MERFEPIIKAVDKEKIKSELTRDKFFKPTNNGGNEIYIVTAHDSPNVMQEIGRLREVSFRDAGGGTKKSTDIDSYDTSEKPFKQLLVWNPVDEEITGGYRFCCGKDMMLDDTGKPLSPTSALFNISEKFITSYLPTTFELGRSFVQPKYQPAYDLRKGFYSLDNLWDGLGALIMTYPDMEYFFGKITMYPRYNITARDMILYFLDRYFPDHENLLTPRPEIKIEIVTDPAEFEVMFTGNNYEENYRILQKNVKRFNEQVPPLVAAYMNLSSTMRTFGTARNHNFGGVEETGILINIFDIYDFKKERHVQ